MPLGEADTRAKLIDPALHSRGWTEDLIRREETAGPVEIVGDRARRRPRGRIDYTLRVKLDEVAAVEVDLPNLSEQQRVVTAIREQMASVRRARVAAEAQLEAGKLLLVSHLRTTFTECRAAEWPSKRLAHLVAFEVHRQ